MSDQKKPVRRRLALARKLRQNGTDVEERLWWALRELELPWKVRRQHPIGEYVVDFAVPACKLVIELDGGQHANQGEADSKRTAFLSARGYRVIRFWNNEVMENLRGVIEAIRREAVNRSLPLPGPLLPKGEEREKEGAVRSLSSLGEERERER